MYDYAYDAGDNMTSKTVPYEDNFDDGDIADGWTTTGTWTVPGGRAKSHTTGTLGPKADS